MVKSMVDIWLFDGWRCWIVIRLMMSHYNQRHAVNDGWRWLHNGGSWQMLVNGCLSGIPHYIILETSKFWTLWMFPESGIICGYQLYPTLIGYQLFFDRNPWLFHQMLLSRYFPSAPKGSMAQRRFPAEKMECFAFHIGKGNNALGQNSVLLVNTL